MVLCWVLVQGVRAALVHFGIDSACPQKFWLWWWREFSLVCIYTHMRHHSPVCNWPPPILGVRHWYFFCRSYLPWVLWSTISGWWNWGALFSGKVLLFGGNIHFLGSDDCITVSTLFLNMQYWRRVFGCGSEHICCELVQREGA